MQKQKNALEEIYYLRMSLRAKINQWAQADPEFSSLCAGLAFQIQQHWAHLEEDVAYWLYQNNKDWPIDQKVFMFSREQLLSNPFVSEDKKMTSLSELQTGDIVVQSQFSSKQEIQSYFVIYKKDDGTVHSLEPQGDLTWTINPLHRAQSWLKRSAVRLTVLRHQTPEKSQQMVESILEGLSRRRPSSFKWIVNKSHRDLLADPQLVNMMEWKNYLSLYQNRKEQQP